MILDIRAFWLIGALITSCCGLLVIVLRRQYPNNLGRALAMFGIANLCLGLDYVLRLGGNWVGQFAFNVAGGTLATVCLSLEYVAVCFLKRREPRMAWVLAPPLAAFLACDWFTFGHRNISFQVTVYNLTEAAVMLLIAVSFLRKEDGRRPFVDVLAAVAFTLLAVATLGAVLDALRTGSFTAEFDFNSARSIFLTAASVLAEAIIFSIFLLTLSERLNRAFLVQAMCDSLTGLYNRRAYEDLAARELSSASRTGHPVSILLLDLDRLKEINDECGHAAGDAAIRAAAELLKRSLRSEDYICRWGGDEFCALLTRAGGDQAEAAARRVLRAIDGYRFSYGQHAIAITASIGVAALMEEDGDLAGLFARADLALYRAKSEGRNCYALAAVNNGAAPAARDLIGSERLARTPAHDLP